MRFFVYQNTKTNLEIHNLHFYDFGVMLAVPDAPFDVGPPVVELGVVGAGDVEGHARQGVQDDVVGVPPAVGEGGHSFGAK